MEARALLPRRSTVFSGVSGARLLGSKGASHFLEGQEIVSVHSALPLPGEAKDTQYNHMFDTAVAMVSGALSQPAM